MHLDQLLTKHPAPWRLVALGTLRVRLDDAQGRPIGEFPGEGAESLGAGLLLETVNRLHAFGPFVSAAHAAAQDMRPSSTLRIAVLRIACEVEEIRRRVMDQQPGDLCEWSQARQALVTIAALTIRTAEDLGIESFEAALDKEIPW